MTYVQGYIERDVSQIQATATKVFGPTLGADSLAFVAEAALMYVHDMPDRSVLRLEGPGTDTSGNPFHSTPAGAHAGLNRRIRWIGSRAPPPTAIGWRRGCRISTPSAR